MIDKCKRYHQYLRTGIEQREHEVFPVTVWVVPDAARRQKLIDALDDAFKKQPKRKKLLEAHYSDAIPLDLMKSEQQKIAKELAAIDHEIDMHNITFEQITANLDMVLDIVENCGEAYRNASDTVKKMMNQAIFEKFYISNGPEDEFGVKLTFKAPYDQILDPIKDDLSEINTAIKHKPEAVDRLAVKAKGHIHDFFGCGPNLGQNKNPYSNKSDFFNPNSSSKDLLVD